ncbi:MAG TPA: spore germination protein [Virgibacillus sp.]|nr:spore germination protein [Virgibacillus sp.]
MSNKEQKSIFPIKIDKLKHLIKKRFAKSSEDLLFTTYKILDDCVAVFYIPYLLDTDKMEDHIFEPLINTQEKWTNEKLLNEIPIGESTLTNSLQDINNKLILGHAFVYIENEDMIVSFHLPHTEKRSVEKAEIESVILGPQVSFTESLDTNMNILRQSILTSDLVFEKVLVGKRVQSEIRIVYLKSLANSDDVQEMRKRLQQLDIDEVEDISVLKQFIEDSSTNLFPQFYSTELPDRLSYIIKKGKIGVLMDDSPTAIIAPSTLFSFLESPEDLYMRWNVGSVLRILRMIAMLISISITPIYVAIVTFQYELIPMELLISIGQSRAAVPFPPIIEALIIEFLVELLREASVRLPTKVGQTIGIVGGIIIGESAVQAGLTSNILIIVVAMSALASYTTPNYLMASSLRIIRFPMILLASIYGIIGIMFGFCFLIIHLLKLTTLNRPYLSPLYPLNLADFNKVFFHLPKQWQSKRAKMLMPKEIRRYSKKEAQKKRDIDE